MDVNLKGAFLVTQQVAPVMTRQGRGVVVLVGSKAGVTVGSGSIAYGASKAGVHGLALTLDRHLDLGRASASTRSAPATSTRRCTGARSRRAWSAVRPGRCGARRPWPASRPSARWRRCSRSSCRTPPRPSAARSSRARRWPRRARCSLESPAELIALRRDLHAHPGLRFDVERTAAIVAERLRAAGWDAHHRCRPDGAWSPTIVGAARAARPACGRTWTRCRFRDARTSRYASTVPALARLRPRRPHRRDGRCGRATRRLELPAGPCERHVPAGRGDAVRRPRAAPRRCSTTGSSTTATPTRPSPCIAGRACPRGRSASTTTSRWPPRTRSASRCAAERARGHAIDRPRRRPRHGAARHRPPCRRGPQPRCDRPVAFNVGTIRGGAVPVRGPRSRRDHGHDPQPRTGGAQIGVVAPCSASPPVSRLHGPGPRARLGNMPAVVNDTRVVACGLEVGRELLGTDATISLPAPR